MKLRKLNCIYQRAEGFAMYRQDCRDSRDPISITLRKSSAGLRHTISPRNVHGNRGKFLEVIFLEVTRFKHVRPHTIVRAYMSAAGTHIGPPSERPYNDQHQQRHSWTTTNRNLILRIELIVNSPGFSII